MAGVRTVPGADIARDQVACSKADTAALRKGAKVKRLTKAAMICAILLAPATALGNDSTARIGVGGLELTKTDNIRMVSEQLEISVARIRVTYRFLNTSDKDIKTTVAFPLPAFDAMGVVGSRGNASPLESFRSFVDGQPVPVSKHRAYMMGNVDVTEKLRKIGLSYEQIFDPQFTCTELGVGGEANPGCHLTTAQLSELVKQNLAGGAIHETAYWEQSFPANKEIEVVHEYKPYVGHGNDHYDKLADYPSAQRRFADVCLDKGAYNVLTHGSANVPSIGDNVQIYYLDVEYILGTGRNWKGPIKNFKLVLKKQSPLDVVSLCFPGKAVKTSPTTMEFSQTDFVPQDKLVVYFFQRHEAPPGSGEEY